MAKTAKMNIGRCGAQAVNAPKGSSGGKQPKKQTGKDLRTCK